MINIPYTLPGVSCTAAGLDGDIIEGGDTRMRVYKNAMKYFAKYPDQNAFVHLLGGIGFGFLLAYPVVGQHPIRWGLLFVGMAVIGHIWAGTQKVR